MSRTGGCSRRQISCFWSLTLYHLSCLYYIFPLYLPPLPSLLLQLHLYHPSHLPHTASVLGLAPLGPCTKRERARSQRSSLSIQAVMGILTRRLCTANRFNTGQGIIKQDAGRANNQVREWERDSDLFLNLAVIDINRLTRTVGDVDMLWHVKIVACIALKMHFYNIEKMASADCTVM